jgi:hypothetical protein
VKAGRGSVARSDSGGSARGFGPLGGSRPRPPGGLYRGHARVAATRGSITVHGDHVALAPQQAGPSGGTGH